jgi:hypothetical protein
MAKKPPQLEKLEEVLRSSKLVYGSFMGTDTRSVSDVIDADNAKLAKIGFTAEQIAAKMQQITDIAITGLGTWVQIDQDRMAKTDEAKGSLVCPWPHPGKFAKRITTVKLTASQQTISWADLSIHLIAEHHFFQGKGSAFRIEPEQLVEMILM